MCYSSRIGIVIGYWKWKKRGFEKKTKKKIGAITNQIMGSFKK
jgi:hypothetical protein